MKPVNIKPILIQKPTEDEGQEAMEFIKKKEDDKKIKEAQEELEKKLAIEKENIEAKVRRKLREKMYEEEEREKIKTLTDLLQSGKKIKWQLNGPGNKMLGYVKDKLVFEIKKGFSVWSLYVKEKSLLKKGQQSYQGCSSNIFELKKKSEKLIK
jgi:UbiD family decarboxylase